MSFVLCFASTAQAQPRPSLAGAWRLETAPHRDTQCVIRGDAVVSARPRNNVWDVRIEVREACPDGRSYDATEQCAATVEGERVTVACRVVRQGASGYIPDQFSLQLRGKDLMVGRLADAGIWNEPVTWRRGPALTS